MYQNVSDLSEVSWAAFTAKKQFLKHGICKNLSEYGVPWEVFQSRSHIIFWTSLVLTSTLPRRGTATLPLGRGFFIHRFPSTTPPATLRKKNINKILAHAKGGSSLTCLQWYSVYKHMEQTQKFTVNNEIICLLYMQYYATNGKSDLLSHSMPAGVHVHVSVCLLRCHDHDQGDHQQQILDQQDAWLHLQASCHLPRLLWLLLL